MAQSIGFIKSKSKSPIQIARTFGERTQNVTGHHFWASGYFVSTVSQDEKFISEYTEKQG